MFITALVAVIAANPPVVMVDRDNVQISESCIVEIRADLIQDEDNNGVIHVVADGLELMKPLVDSGEVSAVNVAYLTDRVRMHEGKPQVYGTQFRRSNGHWEPYPIEDPDRVDERRAALGLPTLAEYKKQLMRFEGKSD